MVTFVCNKLGRDNGLETFKAESVSPTYTLLAGKELCKALALKLIEESYEVQCADNSEAVIAELADVLEVIDGLCKAYAISFEEISEIQEKKRQEKGGFDKGLFIETLQMDETNPRVKHFRASPDKYREI